MKPDIAKRYVRLFWAVKKPLAPSDEGVKGISSTIYNYLIHSSSFLRPSAGFSGCDSSSHIDATSTAAPLPVHISHSPAASSSVCR